MLTREICSMRPTPCPDSNAAVGEVLRSLYVNIQDSMQGKADDECSHCR